MTLRIPKPKKHPHLLHIVEGDEIKDYDPWVQDTWSGIWLRGHENDYFGAFDNAYLKDPPTWFGPVKFYYAEGSNGPPDVELKKGEDYIDVREDRPRRITG